MVEAMHAWVQRAYGKSLYLLLSFAVKKLKYTLFFKSTKTKQNMNSTTQTLN